MSNTTKIIIALAVVAAVAAGAILLTGDKDKTANNGSNNTNNSNNSSDDENIPAAATITYTDAGFSPASTTVKSGEAIRIVNQSSGVVGPSSDPHPTHNINTEINFPDIDPGESATVTVTEKGTWGLHNHLKDDHRATIIVE